MKDRNFDENKYKVIDLLDYLVSGCHATYEAQREGLQQPTYITNKIRRFLNKVEEFGGKEKYIKVLEGLTDDDFNNHEWTA